MRSLRTLDRRLTTFETGVVGGLLIAVSAIVLLQVLMRYLVAQPNPWSEELSRFGFLWMSLLGASLAVQRRAHFGFDRVTRLLPESTERFVRRVAWGAVTGFALLLVGAGVALVLLTLDERSPALGVSYALVYAAAPVSGTLMLIHLLADPSLPRDRDAAAVVVPSDGRRFRRQRCGDPGGATGNARRRAHGRGSPEAALPGDPARRQADA